MKTYKVLTLLLVAFWMAATSPSPRAAIPSAEAKKIARLLKGTGLHYVARKATVWTVDFTARKLGKSTVIVTYDKNLLVTFAIVAKHAAIENTPQLMQTLLRANDSFDYVKIGYDRDGDLIVRIDAPLRLADSRLLKDDVKQVMSVSDDVFGQIGQFIRR
ncbi:MAG TPA: YbjN domain-containing protein [Stellaceae bacterium]|jgi:hypothetical protein|nr:YbjN domain-containing protein [Stellaceae bacterium]